MLDISPVLEFITRTGEKCVFFNPEDRSFFVILPLKEYERTGLKKGPASQGAVRTAPIKEEPFIEPWQTSNAPSFYPEPPVVE